MFLQRNRYVTNCSDCSVVQSIRNNPSNISAIHIRQRDVIILLMCGWAVMMMTMNDNNVYGRTINESVFHCDT